MIRYPVTLAQLEADVNAVKPSWRQRAQERTQRFRLSGKYEEPPAPIWSEIKAIYMRIQNNKCAYCERQLGAEGGGEIEHDVEHFRPKNTVVAWLPKDLRKYSGYTFLPSDNFADGYYLLAYSLLNYAVSCKICNTDCKKNYFPVAGNRIRGQDDPRNLANEQPLLIYPLGDIDEDPMELIHFNGITPVPASDDPTSYAYQRALVTIDMFELVEREELLRERSMLIYGLFNALNEEANGSLENARFVQILLSSRSPHTNCLRCFARLFVQDRTEAEALAEEALLFLEALRR